MNGQTAYPGRKGDIKEDREKEYQKGGGRDCPYETGETEGSSIASGSREIRNVEEFIEKQKKWEQDKEKAVLPQKEPADKAVGTFEKSEKSISKESAVSIQKLVAKPKNPDKDCSSMPEGFLEKYNGKCGGKKLAYKFDG